MPGRRTLLGARLPGDAAGEVRIGAFARRQLRRRIWFGLFGTALIIGAGLLYVKLRPEASAAADATYEAPVRCGECGFEGNTRLSPGQPMPLACPKCGMIRARPLWKCRHCANTFVPPKSTPPVRCPKCNSDNVGSAAQP
jgi:predicted Zn-ribbon and HTH transcriptional regulator